MAAEHKKFLKMTFSLALKGRGLVSPNPMVGAVVVRGSNVIGRGFHRAYGMPHAEAEALKQAGKRAKGASLYVNLEPCCHYGKTPPCTSAIIEAGIKEVFCCMEDPNPLVGGKGFIELEKNGIKVIRGPLEGEARQLNRFYILGIERHRPYIILKWAQTLDGKMANHKGDSMWITSSATRDFVKSLRFRTDGLLVGINTVLNDNPALGCIPPGFQTKSALLAHKRYHKIVLDPSLKMPLGGKIWEDKRSTVLIVVSSEVDERLLSPFLAKDNCRVIKSGCRDGKFDIKELAEKLYSMGVGIIMVEGGSATLTSFWEARLADEVMVFVGNRILGGRNSIVPIGGQDKDLFAMSVPVKNIESEMMGEDLFIRGRPCFQE